MTNNTTTHTHIQHCNIIKSCMYDDLEYYASANIKNNARLEKSLNEGNMQGVAMYQALIKFVKLKTITLRNIMADKPIKIINNNIGLLEQITRELVEDTFDNSNNMKDADYKDLMEGPMGDVKNLKTFAALIVKNQADGMPSWGQIDDVKTIMLKQGHNEERAELIKCFVVDGQFSKMGLSIS